MSSNAREILIEKTNKRRRLCSFGQDRKPLEIREQNRRRARIFRLHLAALLKLLRDWRRQQVVEELLGARLLGGDLDPRLVQFLDRLIMLDQLPAQFQLRQHLARQPA